MVVRNELFQEFEDELRIIKITIAEKVDFNTLSLLDWEDLEMMLLQHLMMAKRKINDQTEYHRKIKTIAKNRLTSIIREYTAEKRHTNSDLSLSDITHPQIIHLEDTTALHPESGLAQDKSKLIQSALWKIVKDKPKVYFDIIRLMLINKSTKIAPVARELNIPRTTLNYHWKQLKKWAEEEGLKKLI